MGQKRWIIFLLLRCSSLVHLQQLHAHLLTNHALYNPVSTNFIGVMLVRCFNEMGAAEADEYAFTSVLKVCVGLVAIVEGKEIHGVVFNKGFKSNLYVRNSLVDTYFKYGDKKTAAQLFDKTTVRDVVSWSTTVAGFSLCGDVDRAREMFDRMPERGIRSLGRL